MINDAFHWDAKSEEDVQERAKELKDGERGHLERIPIVDMSATHCIQTGTPSMMNLMDSERLSKVQDDTGGSRKSGTTLFNRISGEDRPKEIADAYKKKVEECTAKAKVLFPGDPQFATLFQLYEEQAKKEKKTKYTKRIIVLLIIIALVVFVMSR